MIQLKHKLYKNQAIDYKLYKWYQEEFVPTDPFALGKVLAFDPKELMVINILLSYDFRYKHTYFTRETLALIVGCSVRTIQYILNELKSLGLLKTFYRYKQSSFYKISRWFYNPYIKEQLSQKLRYLHIAINRLQSRATKLCTLLGSNVLRNLITKASKAILTNTTNQPVEEKDFQRKILNRKVSMFGEYEIRDTIKNLKIQFTQQQQEFLMKFSDAQLLAAQKKVFAKKEVNNPATLFLWLMHHDEQIKNMHDTSDSNSFGSNETLSTETLSKENKIAENQRLLGIPHPPVPWISKSYQENLNRFGEWYDLYAEEYSSHTKLTKFTLRERFINKLNDLFKDPEAIERWRTNGKEFAKLSMPQLLEKLETLNKEVGKSPQMEENKSFNTNTQNIQKDATELKSQRKMFNFEEI